MIVGVPKEVKDDEYRVAITPAGVRELTAAGHAVFVERGAGVGLVDSRCGVRGHRGEDRGRPGRHLVGVGPGPGGQGADRRRVPAARGPEGPGPLHLPAPGRLPAVHRGPDRRRQHGHRLRDGAPCRQLAATAHPDERGGRPDGPADGLPPPDAPGRRTGHPGVRRARCALRQDRHPRAPAWPAWPPPPWPWACMPRSTSSTATSSACARSTTISGAGWRPWPPAPTPSRRSASTPTSSSARCWSSGPRPPSSSATNWWARCGTARCWSTSRWTRAAASSRPVPPPIPNPRSR